MDIVNFDGKMSESNKTRLTALAKQVFGDATALTKENMIMLIKMDMSTFISELSVSIAITRPTEQKFATNNYHASTKLEVEGIFDIIDEELRATPKEEVIDKYFMLKQAAFNLIGAKYSSTEGFLRGLVEGAAARDSIAPIGRNAGAD